MQQHVTHVSFKGPLVTCLVSLVIFLSLGLVYPQAFLPLWTNIGYAMIMLIFVLIMTILAGGVADFLGIIFDAYHISAFFLGLLLALIVMEIIQLAPWLT